MMSVPKSTNTNVLVSIIMPAYNAERFIEEAIRSVISQTVSDWELLVLDDCSQDRTPEIVKQLASEDVRITLIQNEVNQGVAKTRNRGFDLCRGKYIALLDSDDVWHPEKLELQLKCISENNADIAYCSYSLIDETGVKTRNDFIVPPTTTFENFLIQSVISCSTVLLSRQIVENYRFKDNYYHEDLVLWLQLLQDGYIACGVTSVLARYRVMEGTRASNKLRTAIHRWQIYHNFLGFSTIKSSVLLLRYAFLGIIKYKKHRECDIKNGNN